MRTSQLGEILAVDEALLELFQAQPGILVRGQLIGSD